VVLFEVWLLFQHTVNGEFVCFYSTVCIQRSHLCSRTNHQWRLQ